MEGSFADGWLRGGPEADLERSEAWRWGAIGSFGGEDVVLGLGTDLIEIERIAQTVERFGDAFLGRVFTAAEIRYCQRKKNAAESLAARFAAKEAGAKALGTGISRGVSWREFEVRRLPGQRPELHLNGRAAEIAAQLGVRRVSLSLAHSRGMALAMVVAED
ncbi:MAG: holo-ACP synthase [Acidobacteriaceae bacterium]